MNIVFINQSKTKNVTIYIEPSIDEFILKPSDTIKVECESLEKVMEIAVTYMSEDEMIIWLPRSTKGIVYINSIKVNSYTEMRYW